jgi:assimilatory nitrate reductase catalytic subunit
MTRLTIGYVPLSDAAVLIAAVERGFAAAAGCGPLVCACFSVGRDTIRAAVASGAGDVAAIGEALHAGANCGSGIPEIKRILTEVLSVAA